MNEFMDIFIPLSKENDLSLNIRYMKGKWVFDIIGVNMGSCKGDSCNMLLLHEEGELFQQAAYKAIESLKQLRDKLMNRRISQCKS